MQFFRCSNDIVFLLARGHAKHDFYVFRNSLLIVYSAVQTVYFSTPEQFEAKLQSAHLTEGRMRFQPSASFIDTCRFFQNWIKKLFHQEEERTWESVINPSVNCKDQTKTQKKTFKTTKLKVYSNSRVNVKPIKDRKFFSALRLLWYSIRYTGIFIAITV